MIVLANLIGAIALLLRAVISFLIFVVIARAIVSWVSADPFNPLVRIINSSTEPFLKPIRRIIPPFGPGIDFTPLILILVLYFLEYFLVTTLLDYSISLKNPYLYGVPGLTQ